MSEEEWKGGREDPRLYKQVRTEKQKAVAMRYERICPFLDERTRRLWAGNEAIGFGRGGIRGISSQGPGGYQERHEGFLGNGVRKLNAVVWKPVPNTSHMVETTKEVTQAPG